MKKDRTWMKGSMVALVTPFRQGKVDVPTLEKLVQFQIEGGTSCLVPCGTTGESATLTLQEHEAVIETVIRAAGGKIPVMAGTGSNNTEEAVALTQHAQKAGAQAALVISPYYNRPTQEGLYRHFQTVAQSVEIPLILYNIASRTGVNIEPETFERLSHIPNIAGVKEASGNLEQMSRIQKLCGPEFVLISGDDVLTLPVLAIGGTGVISVVANLVPKWVAQMVAAFEKGDLTRAQELHYQLLPLTRAMFVETNPIPVKTAMGKMGLLPDAGLRLPLCAMTDGNLKRLEEVLQSFQLLA